jgi:aconitate hydratase
MGVGVIRKILAEHIVEGDMSVGKEVAIRIDQTLTQDATGTMAYLQFEALGVERVSTELSVSYIDHNTLQVGPENADDHAYLGSVAARYGILLSRAGNGICHQVHFERFAAPGKTLLGSDSHTPTAGALGMFAVGAGGLDVAAAMAGHPFYLKYPKILNIVLKGQLKPWVSAKDVVLHILSRLTTKGNVGTAIEYSGEGVSSLSAEQRATITNMGAETGVTTSVFPSDSETKRFLDAQGRGSVWLELEADANVSYDDSLEIDISSVVPMMARPHSPGNVVPVEDVKGLAVEQVIIGSCTNSSFRDLSAAAEILKGNTVPAGVSLIVVPGSRQALKMITDSGALEVFVNAGARVLESTCGFCIGNGAAPAAGSVSLRTNNRNFEGRSGTPDAQVYLVSPETAAASALTGEVVDPRIISGEPRTSIVAEFPVDDSMLVQPPADGSGIEIIRPPGMAELSAGREMEEDIAAAVAIKVGDKITTDHIAPGGQRLKLRSNVAAYAQYAFESVDPDFPARCMANKDAGKGSIIVAGVSYGQGSSREHAALCPAYLGVRAVIAGSFERIHIANLVNFGIIPFTFADRAGYDGLNRGDEIVLSGVRQAIEEGEPVTALNRTTGKDIELVCDLSVRQRQILLAGGMLSYLKTRANG